VASHNPCRATACAGAKLRSSWEASLTQPGHIRPTLAADEHAGAIAAFCREAWGEEASAESVLAGRRRAAAENIVTPGEAPPTALVFDRSRVIGHCSSIPQRLWDGVAERPAYWVKGFWVLPQYRNGPIGFLVARELVAQLPRSMSLAAAPAARRLLGALGYTDLGTLANFVRPLQGANLAKRLDLARLGLGGLPAWVTRALGTVQRTGAASLVGAVAGLSASLVARATRGAAARFDVAAATALPSRDELDDLWRRARPDLAASPVRDGLYLRSRFGANGTAADGNHYAFVLARDAGRLDGVAVVLPPKATNDPRLHGIRVATVCDVLFPQARAAAGLAVLGGVERTARAAKADAILCSTSHPAVSRLLRRQGYARMPGNVHFLLRDTLDAARWPRDLAVWWLARGDGGHDVF